MRKCGVVFVAEISGITAEGNYTRVQLADGSSSFVRRGITSVGLHAAKTVLSFASNDR